MAENKEIIITFKHGEAVVEASGFKGQSCKDATKFISDALGNVTDFQVKAEWYEKNIELNGTINTNLCG